MLDLTPHVRPGEGVWWGQAGAEATPLVDALLDQAEALGVRRVFCGLSWNRRLRDLPAGVTLTSYGAMGELRRVATAGRLDVVPGHYSVLPRLFAERRVPGDVGLVQVSPPGPDGRCSLGIGPDYVADAVPHSRRLVAEVNRRMPTTEGSATIPLASFAAVVETDRPLAEAVDREPDDVDAAIAAHVADLVRDGDTVQMGVGALPDAVLAGLSGHRDLGVHSGMITDGVLRLVDAGVVTGARKEVDPGLVVTGAALGSRTLYEGLARMPVRFRPASHTHAPAVLARLRRLVAINAAIEVDLSGQVGGEMAGDRYVGGVGGQADFSGAAARTGACSVVVLRSTVKGRSTVVRELSGGVVTTARADVDVVVTEHGVAWLRGCPVADRAARIAAVAAPEHREDLMREARDSSRGRGVQ